MGSYVSEESAASKLRIFSTLRMEAADNLWKVGNFPPFSTASHPRGS
jgi:hypothetical protein